MNLVDYFEATRQAMVDELIQLIQYESPSNNKAAVDKLGALLKQQFEALGASVEMHARDDVGDVLLAKWQEHASGKPILIISHMDTVWDVGTLDIMPIRIEDDGRLYGPGAVDMKGGIVCAMNALAGLSNHNALPDRPIYYMITTDEEIGSTNSRELIESIAKECALVLITEPPTGDGSLKTWRKGTSRYELTIEGRASHAGNEPEQGVNSIIEFAQQALEINQLNDLKNGTSVSVTVVAGGTASNVIPAKTTAQIDVRVMSLNAYNKVHSTLMDRVSYIPGSKVTVERKSFRPPMERNGEAFERVREIASGIGMTVREDGAGGGSDGNFTAALGIPTIDGLGAEGTGLHAAHEHVLMNSLPKKAALIAAIIHEW